MIPYPHFWLFEKYLKDLYKRNLMKSLQQQEKILRLNLIQHWIIPLELMVIWCKFKMKMIQFKMKLIQFKMILIQFKMKLIQIIPPDGVPVQIQLRLLQIQLRLLQIQLSLPQIQRHLLPIQRRIPQI